jgi:hypothetical protein
MQVVRTECLEIAAGAVVSVDTHRGDIDVIDARELVLAQVTGGDDGVEVVGADKVGQGHA